MHRPSTVFTITSPSGRRSTVHHHPSATASGRAILTTADGRRVHTSSDATDRVAGSDAVFQVVVVAGRGQGGAG